MNEPFGLEVVAAGPRATVVRIRGTLDGRSAPRLLEECHRAGRAGHNLVLNLAAVTFVSSSGIGAMLALVEEFHGTPLSVRLTELSPAAASVIRVLNLDQFLDIHPTEQDGLDAAGAEAA